MLLANMATDRIVSTIKVWQDGRGGTWRPWALRYVHMQWKMVLTPWVAFA